MVFRVLFKEPLDTEVAGQKYYGVQISMELADAIFTNTMVVSNK